MSELRLLRAGLRFRHYTDAQVAFQMKISDSPVSAEVKRLLTDHCHQLIGCWQSRGVRPEITMPDDACPVEAQALKRLDALAQSMSISVTQCAPRSCNDTPSDRMPAVPSPIDERHHPRR